jgi:hypothetical protein
MSTKAPLRTALSDTYPNPSNAVLRTGMGALWDFVKAKLGIDVAPVSIDSSATVNIGAADSTNITIAGTTTITAFDAVEAGFQRDVTFSGALTLTHNATSLILPGGANITTTAGDCATFLSLGSGNWRCIKYQHASASAARASLGLSYGPTFRAYAAAGANITSSAATKISIGSKDFDPDNVFDYVNFRFKPTVAGYYRISAGAYLITDAAATQARAIIYKNGSEYSRCSNSPTSGASRAAISTGSDLVYLNGTTDYVELYVFQDSGVNASLIGGASVTYMSGELVRPA